LNKGHRLADEEIKSGEGVECNRLDTNLDSRRIEEMPMQLAMAIVVTQDIAPWPGSDPGVIAVRMALNDKLAPVVDRRVEPFVHRDHNTFAALDAASKVDGS
jgi:hypothetical protein